MLTKQLASLCGALQLAACVHAPVPAAPAAAPAVAGAAAPMKRDQIVPLVDAHQHMMSPAAMALPGIHPDLPAIDLPAALATLLKSRESFSNASDYDQIFSGDAILFAEEHGRWWTGKERLVDAIANFPSELRFVPTAYASSGSAGFISGHLQSSDGASTHNFTLGLRKEAGGGWRIASEMKQPIMPPLYAPAITAEKIIEVLDDAGIRKGVVLSLGYWFGAPSRNLADPAGGTRAENDWTVAETGKFPDRLIPFCSVNPLADYAISEVERCAAIPRVRGMKIHFNNSRINLGNPDHVAKMRAFFSAANRHKLAIVAHVRAPLEPFIDQVLPEAPDIPVQIAHMASGWQNARLFADAIEAGKPGTANLLFDWTQAMPIEGLWGYGPSAGLSGTSTAQEKADAADVMRRLGLHRILYGNDMPLAWNPTPREWWRKTILTLPLTDEEIRDIADNVPAYVR